MSRIKGAMKMDGPKEPVQGDGPAPMKSSLKPIQRDRWVPPALRPKTVNFVDEEHHEVFAVTAEEPSFSPLPSDSQPSVSLPKISTRRDFVNRKQLLAFTRAPLAPRYDILSFDPPVEGMRRDFNLNFILFRRPPIVKGQIKPRVCIPRWRGPRVYAPGKLNGTGSFSKATVADGVSSWRKPAVSPAAEEACAGPSFDTGLETQSRSPPPELVIPPSTTASTSKPSEPTPTKSEGSSVLRPRSQPKMPAGSAVAFRRDSRIDVADENIKPSVNFIVSDELEETADAPKDEPQPAPEPQPSPGQLSTVPPDATSSTAPGPSPQPGSNPESKANESSVRSRYVDRAPPIHLALQGDRASQPSPWSRPSVNLPVKDSSARGPDPEHLKALWSQKSDKREQLQPVNSLEGIADDLTPIPFTFPEVKSESGSTPPLNGPQAPSRMSLHDVTRAFQTVPQPSASNNAPARPAISPPSTNAPVARPTPAITTVNASAPPNPGYSYVPMPPNGRPVYGSYPSPLMSHSPAPGMVYSPHPHPMGGSPVPARMAVNPQHSLYGWMPVPGHGSPAPNGPMRSPYPAQLMAYGTPPGGAPVPYPQPVPPMQRQPMPNGAQGNRNHNSAISPIMSHAPVYHSSPMMVHSPLAPHQNHAAYMPNGRGQPRADNSNNGMNGPQPHPQQQQQHMPPHMMYPPNPHAQSGPSQPYARTW
ncbi:hypothetical protein BKA70DRAFT_1252485 [Coprinopsis sp. MPI-PUGE-AT-0042]|nr:hypothetical protein BKA70DRAFT_1252485 [Coprinopsis sp. MPI-PUGE-AT-0042]